MKNHCGLVVMVLLLSAGVLVHAQFSARHVNQQRLWTTIEKLSEFGRPAGVGFEGGVTRLGFSEADFAARTWLMQLMREAGLAVRVDPAGNIFGRRPGTENLSGLLFGSHIDSVVSGGNFDGDVGALGALEVIRALNDGGPHPSSVGNRDLDERGRESLQPRFTRLERGCRIAFS